MSFEPSPRVRNLLQIGSPILALGAFAVGVAGCLAGAPPPPAENVSVTAPPEPAGAETASAPLPAGRAARIRAAPAGALPEPARALLEAHNRHRVAHCAPPLAWSPRLEQAARRWAGVLARRGCALEHSGSGLGENLAAGTVGTLGAARAVALWYSEAARYDFRRPTFSMRTGHFTQVVWRGTTHLGCARAVCPELELWVCNYDPAGNLLGAFAANVLPTTCRR